MNLAIQACAWSAIAIGDDRMPQSSGQDKIIWGLGGWVFVHQALLECGGVVETLGFEDVGNVAAGEDDDGVGVFAYFGIGLGVEVGGGD
jgi:hypothetical protein